MSYQLIARRDGTDDTPIAVQGSLADAKRLGQELLAQQDVYSVRLIEVDGSGNEVASINRDTLVWDDV